MGFGIVDHLFVDTSAWVAVVNSRDQYHQVANDQCISLTDAVSFKIMEKRQVKEAFTFNSHFSTAGFIKLPLER